MAIKAQLSDNGERETGALRAICHRQRDGLHLLRFLWPDSAAITLNWAGEPAAGARGPFPRSAGRYFAADYAPFPLPAGQKQAPPKGFTGNNGKRATITQIKRWLVSSKYENGNIAMWFGTEILRDGRWYQLIGIDVDQYDDKTGGEQLKQLETRLVCLPETWTSGARIDGVSGIRWFLAPAEIKFHNKADTNIEIIQRHHRYALVWPSVHPNGGTYWWYPPGLAPDAAGRSGSRAWTPDHDLPVLVDLPVLPAEWVIYLTKGPADHHHVIDYETPVSDLVQWADDEFNSGAAGDLCWNLASAISTWKRRIDDDESSHDKITDALWMIHQLAAEGHTGWKDASTQIETYWRDDVLKRGKRSSSEADAEIFRSVTGALRKIKPKVDSKPVPAQCECYEGGSATLWHSANAPLGVAKQLALLADREEKPLQRWRGDWYQYSGQHWKMLSDDAFSKMLYDALGDARCWSVKNNAPIPWNPDENKLRKVAHALRSLDGVFVSDSVVPPRWLDGRNDKMIAFRNTLLRVSDRKQIDHTPTYFNTFVLPFGYDPIAPQPNRWLKFLEELWPDDPESIARLQEWFGYILSGRTNHHKMLLLLGPKRSGKTTIAYVLKQMVGAANYTEARSDSIAAQFGLESLIGKTLVLFDDDRVTGNAKRFTDTLKNIIGEGEIPVHRKYKTDWLGRLSVRFVYIANEISALPDSSGAIVSRILPLQTSVTFEGREDRGLWKKLDAELGGIFNWALDGLVRLDKQGDFTRVASNDDLLASLQDMSSPVTEFIDELCEWDQDGFVSDQLLFSFWRDWCERNGFVAGNISNFMSKIRAAYGASLTHCKRGSRGNQRRGYIGIKLRERKRTVDRLMTK